LNTHVVSFNFPAFHEAAKGLREQGWSVFNPAEVDEANGHDFTGYTGHENLSEYGFNLRDALGADLDFITRRADAVAVLPGWENSKGARAEVATARALGLPVFDAIEGPSRPIADVGSARISINPSPHADLDIDKFMASMKRDARALAEVTDTPPMVEERRNGFPESIWPEDDDQAEVNRRLGTEGGEAFPIADQLPGDDWLGLHTVSPETHPARPGPNADGEVRTVSSTGGQKGKKPEQYDQIPTAALAELARHFGYGADKYAAHNFRKGYAWSLCFNALMRHALLFWSGEDYDVHKPDCAPDCTDHLPKSKHIIAVAWHALALSTFMDEHPEFDDRYKPEVSA
jgi:hypothetical protein